LTVSSFRYGTSTDEVPNRRYDPAYVEVRYRFKPHAHWWIAPLSMSITWWVLTPFALLYVLGLGVRNADMLAR